MKYLRTAVACTALLAAACHSREEPASPAPESEATAAVQDNSAQYLSDCMAGGVETRTPELAGLSYRLGENPVFVEGPQRDAISAETPAVVDCPFARADGGGAVMVRIRVTCLQAGANDDCVSFVSQRPAS